MSITDILNLLLIISILICLLVSRNKFSFSDPALSKKSKTLLIAISSLILLPNIIYLGFAYYQTYYPNYDYEKTSKLVDYHIYKPSYLPSGIVIDSKYYIYEKEFYGTTNAVRTAFGTPPEVAIKGIDHGGPIVITQTKVSGNFDLKRDVIDKVTSSNVKIIPITLASIPIQRAFMQTGGPVNLIFILTNDNVFISIGGVKISEDELQKVANSLR